MKIRPEQASKETAGAVGIRNRTSRSRRTTLIGEVDGLLVDEEFLEGKGHDELLGGRIDKSLPKKMQQPAAR